MGKALHTLSPGSLPQPADALSDRIRTLAHIISVDADMNNLGSRYVIPGGNIDKNEKAHQWQFDGPLVLNGSLTLEPG
jgi:hypothetical protein